MPTRTRFETDRLLRRTVALSVLVLLLVCGPAHLWHHLSCADETGPPGQDAHQCLPCSVFAHLLFLDPGGMGVLPEPVPVCPVVLLEPTAPSSVTLPLSPARAPPSLLS